jgi:hypothetical protein
MPRVRRTGTTPTPCTPMYQARNHSSMERRLTETITMDTHQSHPGGLAPRYNFRHKDMARPRTARHRHINMARSQRNTTRAKQPRLELIHRRIPCRLVDLYATIIPDLHQEENDREKMGKPLDHPAMGDSMGHVETSHENIGHTRLTISHRPHDRAGSTNPSSLYYLSRPTYSRDATMV